MTAITTEVRMPDRELWTAYADLERALLHHADVATLREINARIDTALDRLEKSYVPQGEEA